jgi:ribosomal protein L29
MKAIAKHEIKNFTSAEISDKIIETQKDLLSLKLKHATRQSIKTHLFKKYKRTLAQLLTEQRKFNNSSAK